MFSRAPWLFVSSSFSRSLLSLSRFSFFLFCWCFFRFLSCAFPFLVGCCNRRYVVSLKALKDLNFFLNCVLEAVACCVFCIASWPGMDTKESAAIHVSGRNWQLLSGKCTRAAAALSQFSFLFVVHVFAVSFFLKNFRHKCAFLGRSWFCGCSVHVRASIAINLSAMRSFFNF